MRFVIQEHQKDQDVHWDLMLAESEHLATWQISVRPAQWGEIPIPCQKIFDHRLMYLSYEGALSENRGQVRIVASGIYLPILLSENQWHVRLESDSISGNLVLETIREDQWELTFQGDTA